MPVDSGKDWSLTVRREIDLTFTSKLSASVERVWAHAVSMDGVNFELSLWVRMSVPRERAQKTIADAPLEQEAFVSTLCALGVFPFDSHHLTVASRRTAAASLSDRGPCCNEAGGTKDPYWGCRPTRARSRID